MAESSATGLKSDATDNLTTMLQAQNAMLQKL
jgi:hypothetical protein